MFYDIKIEWSTSKRGFHALRCDPALRTKQVNSAETHFQVGEIDSDDGHWGKAGRIFYSQARVFNDDAVEAFKVAVEKAVGPVIWEELYDLEVTGTPDEEAWTEFLEENEEVDDK